jgi:hypothetical protein
MPELLDVSVLPSEETSYVTSAITWSFFEKRSEHGCTGKQLAVGLRHAPLWCENALDVRAVLLTPRSRKLLLNVMELPFVIGRLCAGWRRGQDRAEHDGQQHHESPHSSPSFRQNGDVRRLTLDTGCVR